MREVASFGTVRMQRLKPSVVPQRGIEQGADGALPDRVPGHGCFEIARLALLKRVRLHARDWVVDLAVVRFEEQFHCLILSALSQDTGIAVTAAADATRWYCCCHSLPLHAHLSRKRSNLLSKVRLSSPY